MKLIPLTCKGRILISDYVEELRQNDTEVDADELGKIRVSHILCPISSYNLYESYEHQTDQRHQLVAEFTPQSGRHPDGTNFSFVSFSLYKASFYERLKIVFVQKQNCSGER